MSDEETEVPDADEWAAFATEVNETFLTALEQNVEAQAEFVNAWTETVGEGYDAVESPDELLDSYARAYEVWMEAAERHQQEFLEGGDVSPTDARDRWLEAANTAFKEVMGTSAFASATGRAIENALEIQREANEAAEDTLQGLGFATRSEILEIGERLVELERRQHDIEETLERILEAVEE